METAIMMEIEVNASYGAIHFYICCFAFVWRAKVSVRRTKAIEGRVEANARWADVSDNECAASKDEREASGGERKTNGVEQYAWLMLVSSPLKNAKRNKRDEIMKN